jgi:hypothetical protein
VPLNVFGVLPTSVKPAPLSSNAIGVTLIVASLIVTPVCVSLKLTFVSGLAPVLLIVTT